MWKLTIEDDQTNKTVVNLVRDVYTLGRAKENTVRLTERNISRHHARLVKNGSGWVVEDLSSYNGCFVNGTRVSGQQPLSHGDLLQVGDYRLEAIDESQATDSQDFHTTVRGAAGRQSLVGQPHRLVMLVGPTPGVEFALIGERLVVGRGEECQIALNHASVSRVHAEIVSLPSGRFEIIDRNSANGVRINGVELARALLDSRDVIELGDVILKFIPAGEIYRPGADESQQIGINESPPSSDRSAGDTVPASRSKKVLPTLLVAGVVVAGLILFLGRQTGEPSVEAEASKSVPASEPVSNPRLARASALADGGDLQSAHQLLASELERDPSIGHSPVFREIEARWADSLFEQAEGAIEPDEKRQYLEQIAKSTTVDRVRRKRAAQAMAELSTDGIDVSDLPESKPARMVRTGPPHPAGVESPQAPDVEDPRAPPKPPAEPAMAESPKGESPKGESPKGDSQSGGIVREDPF